MGEPGEEPMASEKKFRHYVVLDATKEIELQEHYYREDHEAVANYIAQQAFKSKTAEHFRVIAWPSNVIGRAAERPTGDVPRGTVALVAALEIDDADTVHQMIKAANNKEQRHPKFLGSGADIPFAGTDHWCPGEASDPIFADRQAAEVLLGMPFLKSKNGTTVDGTPIDTTGRNVQVVIVDQGLDQRLIPSKNFGGGWPVHGTLPGATQPKPDTIRRTHGMMIAQNILAVAPEVKLFDLPMVPRKIGNIQDFFVSTANAAYLQMLSDIRSYQVGQYPGPWILVNPWGIFDTESEFPTGNYTNDPTHPFNLLVAGFVSNNVDVVFAAGNCGQFCPDTRCGDSDIGPGNDILGANSLGEVLTVGAVRADTMWLGYSSQGPGQPRLAHDKPDLCAPSQFCETEDAFTVNTGTSAACALAGGVVAALRSTWNSATVSPGRLKTVLNTTARKTPDTGNPRQWKARYGHGILDAEAAFKKLP